MAAGDAGAWLLCRAGETLCALPVAAIVETLRLPPVRPLAGAPSFVSGLAIVRGTPLPIVVVHRLLGAREGPLAYLVAMRVGNNRVGLAVASVVGVRALPNAILVDLPPFMGHEAPVSDIGALDGDLLLMLDAARLVPDEVFALLDIAVLAS